MNRYTRKFIDFIKLRQLANVQHGNAFAKGVNYWFAKHGVLWHDFKLSEKDGDAHQDIAKSFLAEVNRRYQAPRGPLSRAISRPELLNVLSNERIGIDKRNPIRGKDDHIDPAEYLAENNSINLLGTAFSTETHHSFFYAAQYAKFHGLYDSYILLMALPRVFMRQSLVAQIYPDAYTAFDKRESLKKHDNGPESYVCPSESSLDLAKKPEITVVTGMPGRPDIDLRPKMRELVGIAGLNTPRKARYSLFAEECPTRAVHDCILNDGFAPLTYSFEICGSLRLDPELREIVTENGHSLGLIPIDARPLVLEDIVGVLDEMHQIFPRLHRKGLVRASTDVLSTLPRGIKSHEVLDYVVEAHRPFYEKEKEKVREMEDAQENTVKP